MKDFVKTLCVVALLCLTFASPHRADAAPAYAINTAYFDYNGNLVGQKIQWCNNKRFSQGNVNSQYQRNDWYLCYPYGNSTSAFFCSGGGESLSCHWVTSMPSDRGGIATDGGYLLPPGMTVEDSCVMTRDCSPPPPEPMVYGHVTP